MGTEKKNVIKKQKVKIFKLTCLFLKLKFVTLSKMLLLITPSTANVEKGFNSLVLTLLSTKLQNALAPNSETNKCNFIILT